MNRRQFLQATAGAALAAGWPRTASAAVARRKAPFRVLYSNDSTNIVSCISPWHKSREPFREKMLEATVDEVAGTGVDAHLLQPGLGWIPWWKSKVYPAEEHYRCFKERTGFDPDSFGKYMLAGGDMVKVFVERCRKKGQAPFISLRMNDGHHLENAGLKDRRAAWASKFYVEHPEYRLGPDPARWEQHVLNWAIPEVRAHKFAFVRELCENYDLDGFEMDFMRHYSYFQLDKTTSEQRRGIMTAFVRQVRELLDRTARDGRRRWLCARVPAYMAAHDPLGLDLPAMVKAGLDMVNLSMSYFTVQQTDLAAIRRSVPQAAVYLEMCHSIWNGRKPVGKGYDTFPFRRATPEQFYTAAHLAYARGADGVSAFNFVYYREHGGPGRGPFTEPPFHVFKHLGDREWLARQPQHWFLAPGWGNPFVKPSVLPRKMMAGKAETFTLDLAPPTGGWKRDGRLRIQGEDPLGESRWTARLNGKDLAATDDLSEPYPNPYPPMLGKPEELRAWRVPASVLKDGPNQIELTMTAGKPVRVAFMDLALA
ncbi:MAG: hypothetical protein HZC54_04000 [Verrucomicrobia bacterium]|nr:hypothetical protein [Verrucomicrobiota bacterium]